MNKINIYKVVPSVLAMLLSFGCTKGLFIGKPADDMVDQKSENPDALVTFEVGGQTSSILKSDEGVNATCLVKKTAGNHRGLDVNIYNRISTVTISVVGIDNWMKATLPNVVSETEPSQNIPSFDDVGKPIPQSYVLFSHREGVSYASFNRASDRILPDYNCTLQPLARDANLLMGTFQCDKLIRYESSNSSSETFTVVGKFKCPISYTDPADTFKPPVKASPSPSPSLGQSMTPSPSASQTPGVTPSYSPSP